MRAPATLGNRRSSCPTATDTTHEAEVSERCRLFGSWTIPKRWATYRYLSIKFAIDKAPGRSDPTIFVASAGKPLFFGTKPRLVFFHSDFDCSPRATLCSLCFDRRAPCAALRSGDYPCCIIVCSCIRVAPGRVAVTHNTRWQRTVIRQCAAAEADVMRQRVAVPGRPR